MKKTSFLRSPLRRWVGSKYDFLPMIFDMIPKDIELSVEPFCGSAVFTLNLVEATNNKLLETPKRRCISDSNGAVFYTYYFLKHFIEETLVQLESYKNLHSESFYKKTIFTFNSGSRVNNYSSEEDFYKSRVITVCDFLYLHYTCFNGLYRENSKGDFNVPIGRDSQGNLLKFDFDKTLFIETSKRLANIDLYMYDFTTTIEMYLSKYFNYKLLYFLDPPYYKTYSSYSKSSFSLLDHINLINLVKKIDKEGHYFMLFNSDNILYRESLKDFNYLELSRKGIINCKGTKRSSVKELMFYNFDT